MELENNLLIQCKCGNIIEVDKNSLDVDTYSYERSMGEEIEYDFVGECTCGECGRDILVKVFGYEYPAGAFNYSSCKCEGGEFLQEPSVEIEYYEFDEIDEDAIYKEVSEAEYIIEQKERIRNMSSREFEYFVADIFESKGYVVQVTQATRDGGCDIIATKNDGLVPYMILIECKHYSQKHKVSVELVRSLYGVQNSKRANKSVLVTSSTFTSDAREFAESQNTLITLVDIDDLLNAMNI